MNKILLILMAFLLMLTFGCSQNKAPKKTEVQPVTVDSTKPEEKTEVKIYFPKPDKIAIYKDGKMHNLTEEDKIFSDIFITMNGRVKHPERLGQYSLAFGIDDMNNLKKNETVVEFIYSKAADITVHAQKTEFYSLIFPLTGKRFDMCFFDRHLNHYGGPIGSLDNVGDVLSLLDKYLASNTLSNSSNSKINLDYLKTSGTEDIKTLCENLSKAGDATSINNLLKQYYESNMDKTSYVYFAAESGEFYLYPNQVLPKDYDARKRPWYTESIKNTNFISEQYQDITTGNNIITFAKAVSKDNVNIGVAGIDRIIK